MQTTFYFTLAETQIFNTLSDSLKEGWSVEAETLSYDDTAERRQVRLDLMELDNGQFENIIMRCGPSCTAEELQQVVKEVDFTNLSQKDMWEICFALGSEAMTYLIVKVLIDARDDDQMEGVCALTYLRHQFLESVQ